MSSDYTFDDMVQRTLDVGVLSQQQTQDIWSELGSKAATPEVFLQSALRRGWLTNYQVDRLVAGETTGYFFGPYKALYMVGAGTFARVFRAVHRDTGQVAALKILRARFSDNAAFINHFMTEAKIVSQLRHPNIVPVYGANSGGFLHYMAMEFVEGQTLREFLKIRKKVEAKTVAQIGIDVCSGLEYALRTQKLPHRDLKLSNIMLSSTGQSKIVDFGLASIAQDKAGEEIPFLKNQQSIDYIALEKASSAPKMDPRSDLYFLGCVMYQLLCGQSPFVETKDRSKRLDRNRFFNVKPIQTVEQGIPGSFSFIINKALMVNVDQRYQTPSEMLIDLRGVIKRIEAGGADETAATLRFDGIEALQKDREQRIQKLERKTVMLVDSNPKTLKGLEGLMAKFGYQTVSVSEPDEIIKQFQENDLAAQCIIFNAQSLGMRAVRGYNDFAQRRGFKDVAAVLILDTGQGDWADTVAPQHHRIVLTMPITVRQFRESMTWLMEGFGKKD
ncbi:MAG: serine/threonine protein kinase [Planctomycetaceae bacterium]|jgi:serine/threonine-protein kinase|nr:serine/threonine protein kinase [Planctomycetaceae bacterium]